MSFGVAIVVGLCWPIVLPFYGLYRLISPTVTTRADEHAELLRLRALAREHNLPLPEPTKDGDR